MILPNLTTLTLPSPNQELTRNGDDRRVDHRADRFAGLLGLERVLVAAAAGVVERDTAPLEAIVAPLGLK